MTERTAGVGRRTTKRQPATQGGEPYRPSHHPHKPAVRSPYPSRPREALYVEEEEEEETSVTEEEVSGYLEEEGEEKKGVLEYESLSDRSVDSVKMARKEETEVGRLLKYIIERDAEAKKAEARRGRSRNKEKRGI